MTAICILFPPRRMVRPQGQGSPCGRGSVLRNDRRHLLIAAGARPEAGIDKLKRLLDALLPNSLEQALIDPLLPDLTPLQPLPPYQHDPTSPAHKSIHNQPDFPAPFAMRARHDCHTVSL